MKKFVSLLMVLVVTCVFSLGCGEKKKETKTPEPVKTAEPDKTK